MQQQDIRTFSYLSYIGPFFLVGLCSDIRCHPALRFHLHQGMALAAGEAVAVALQCLVDRLLGHLPILALIPSVLFLFFTMCAIALSLYGLCSVAGDRCRPLPVIGTVTLFKPASEE